jgi:hypothetical protein
VASAHRARVTRALGTPLAVGDVAIVPLLEHRSSTVMLGGRLAWHGERRPVGVVVKRAGTVRAFLIDGRECDPGSLLAEFPALSAWLG